MARTFAAAVLMCFLAVVCAAQSPAEGTPQFAHQPSQTVPALKAENAIVIAPVAPAKSAPPVHRFFDRTNLALTAMNFSLQMSDAVTTQHLLSQSPRLLWINVGGQPHPYIQTFTESNPVARPFVTHGWAGEAAYTSLVLGADLGLSYAFHRTGHHKLERIVPMIFGAVGVYATTRNARMY